MQPLLGTTILDLSRLLPGGLCSLLLADLGADVIKVEEPGRGDYMRSFPPEGPTQMALFAAINRGKRSLTLNLKCAEGRALLLELVRHADVVLESFRPGVLARLGLAYEVLQAANPQVIICAISGYGQRGPLAQRAGHDLNYQGYAGALPFFAPRGGGRSIVPGLQVADLGGGALAAALGIVAALLERVRVGTGQVLDVAMTDGVLHWLALYAAEQGVTGAALTGGRGLLSGGYACYSLYGTADGRVLVVAPLEAHFWATFCTMIGRVDLIPLQYAAWPVQERMFAELEALFATRTLAEWLAFFGDADVCVSPALTLDEALASFPDRQVTIAQPGVGTLRLFAGLFGTTAEGPAPDLGAHSAEVLGAYGYAAEEIVALKQRGVI